MERSVGVIREISRYPVKSFGGESLERCELVATGLRGDRMCAFYDETKSGWRRYVTARNVPDMLAYQASCAGGEVRVTAPDGRRLGWGPELLAEMQRRTPTVLAMSEPGAAHPEHSGLLSVDEAGILLLTDTGLKRLEELWGERVDPRRFRGNLIVAVEEGAPEEETWLGRRLTVGDAELRIDSGCERCTVITMDPDTRVKDSSLLRTVQKNFGLRFGLYASVVKPGAVRLGDAVRLLGADDHADDQ